MGMAASQVRFLSLQNRKNTIGLNLMTLSNRKTALSRDMNRVAAEYNNAMNQKVLKWSNDNGVTYTDLNYDLLMKPSDMNANLPYIITDAQGRVVVDDNEIFLPGTNTGTGVTYRQLATMISAYSGGGDDGLPTYNYTDNLQGYTGGSIITRKAPYDTVDTIYGSAISGGAIQNGEEYKIISNVEDFNFRNSLRYDLMEKLGLITHEEKKGFDNLVTELYGSEDALKRGYAIETNDTWGTVKDNTNGFGLFKAGTDAAGEITAELEGGSAIGNYQLAKKYLEEYELYLNTPMTFDLKNNTNPNINDYAYNKDKSLDTGITKRFINALTQTKSTGTDITADNVDSTGLYTTPGWNFLGSIGVSGKNGEGLLNKEYSGQGSEMVNIYFSTKYGDAEEVYDSSRPDYPDGLTWKKLSQDNCYAVYQAFKTQSNGQIHSTMGALANVVEGLRTSLKNGTNIVYNSEAGDYAYYMTLAKFANNTDLLKSAKDSETGDTYASGSYEAIKVNIDYAIANDPAKGDAMGCIKIEDGKVVMDKKASILSGEWGRGRGDHAIRESIYRLWKFKNDNDKSGNGLYVSSHRDTKPDKEVNTISMQALIETYFTFYTAYCEAQDNGKDVPDVVWVKGSAIYTDGGQTTTSTTKSNVLNGFSSTSDATTAYYDATGDTYQIKDDNDKNTYPEGYWSNIQFIDTDGDGYDDELGEGYTQAVCKYIWWNDKLETGLTSLWSTLNSSEKKFVESLYQGDGLLPSEGKQLHGELQQRQAHIVTESDAEIKTISKTYKNGDVTCLVIEEYNNSGQHTQTSYTFDYGSPQNAVGKISKYTEYYDPSTGDFVSAETTKNSVNCDTTFATKTGHILQCSISTGEEKYKLTDSLINSDTAMKFEAKPEDTGLKSALESLVTYWENKTEELKNKIQLTYDSFENRGMDYFDALFKKISESGWVYDAQVNNSSKKEESKNYLNAKLQNNMYFINEVDTIDGTDFNYAVKLAKNVSKVFEVYDTDAQNVALSKYESEKADINSKEKVIDIRMNKLETEQDAIKTELDSIKTIIKDNVDKNFKIFS